MASWVPGVLADIDERVPYRRHELRLALERFAAWAEGEAALEGDPSELLSVRNIELFAQTGLPDYVPASRTTIRSRLLRISELIADPQNRRVRLRPLGPIDPLAPYTPGEVAALHSWADSQVTERRRRNCRTLLALGLGAGLTAAEISEARVGEYLDGAIHVRGGRPRVVPVLNAYATELDQIVAAIVDPTRYLFRPERQATWPNVISNFVASGKPSGLKPHSQRMRSTWVVTHLAASTNVIALVRAAGVESLEAFTRYLRFVAEPDPTEARHQLISAGNSSRGSA
ncbi:hypothetical protein [Pseudolysinimonas sp.]